MEELLQNHRKQQRNLQTRITQKKKAATKKTRKGVNDECAELERQLTEQQAHELAALDSESAIVEDELVPVESGPPNPVSERVPPLGATKEVEQKGQSLSVSSQALSNGQVKRPNRQKARLAKRAAEQEAAAEQAEKEAANLPNLRQKEIESMREAYSAKGLMEHDIRSDGHCLYAAVADQLHDAGIDPKPVVHLQFQTAERGDYALTRHVAAAFIERNADDFVPFLEQPLPDHVTQIRETAEWGGHLEILALAKAYGADINILHGDGHVDTIESGSTAKREPLWLAYYRHSYGLGEHYNSLRRKK